MHVRTRGILLGSCAAVFLLCRGADLSAATVIGTNTDNLNHSYGAPDAPNLSAFFTASPDGTTVFTADNGWAPTSPTVAATISTLTTAKSYSIVGNSTAAGNWVDGNKVPAGMTLTFNAQFSITARGQQYLTLPGASGSSSARGIGVTFQEGPTGIDDIDAGEGLGVSAVTVSNVAFSGTVSDPGYEFTTGSGSVSNFGTRVFRSNNFNEASAGMLLTNQGGGTIGFGLATGSIASNLAIDNGFVAGSFDRQTTPYTLDVTVGTSVIKGIGMAYDVSYDIQPVPEPSTAMVVIGGLATAAVSRRRRSMSR